MSTPGLAGANGDISVAQHQETPMPVRLGPGVDDRSLQVWRMTMDRSKKSLAYKATFVELVATKVRRGSWSLTST